MSTRLHHSPTVVAKDHVVISQAPHREVLGGSAERLNGEFLAWLGRSGVGGRCFRHSAQPLGRDSSGHTGNKGRAEDRLGHVQGVPGLGLGTLGAVHVPGDAEWLGPRLDPFQMPRGPWPS